MKRIISVFLAAVMLFSVNFGNTAVFGASKMYAEEKLESIQKLSGFVPGNTSIVTGNCYAFVSKVCEKLFGTEYQEELYNGYQCKHRTGKFYEVALLKTTTDTSTASINKIINFFIKYGMPGDVVHYGSLSNSSSTHTFMIQSVDSKKMRIFHSNYSTREYGSETCHIDTIYWDSFRENPTSSVYTKDGKLYSHNSLFWNKMRYSGMGVTINRYTKYDNLYYRVGAESSIPPTISGSRTSPYSIKVSWNNVSGATKYNVQYKLSSESSYKNASNSCTSTSFDVKNLTIGSQYNFRVRAYANGKWRDFSNVLTAKALPPTVGSATIKPADKGMYLQWPKKTDLTSVKIYKKLASEKEYKQIKNLKAEAYYSTDTNVKYGETYNYKIIRCVTKGNTTYTSPEKVFTKKYELKTPNLIHNRLSTSSVEVIAETDGCQSSLVYKVTKNGNKVKDGSTKNTTFTVSGLELGTEYTISVAEKTSIGSGSYGNMTFTVLPKDMENIKAVQELDGIRISYETQNDVDGYKIYRSTSKDKDYAEIANVGKGESSYLDKNIKMNTTYYYQVKSHKTYKNKTYYSYCFTPSNAVKYSLPATQKLVVKRTSPNAVRLTWKAVKFAEKYTVQYKEKGKDWETIKDVTRIKEYPIPKLKTGKYYYFRVRAVNHFGNGTFVKSVRVKILPPTPEKPTAKVLKKAVRISYTPKKYATGYIVYRSRKKNSGYQEIATIKGNKQKSFDDRKAKKGKTYYYKIVCYKTVDGNKYKSAKSGYVKVKR